MIKKPLANRLRVFRAERGFSQFDTARLAGMSRDRFWRIESGYTDPTDEEMGTFARMFGVEVVDIFPKKNTELEA